MELQPAPVGGAELRLVVVDGKGGRLLALQLAVVEEGEGPRLLALQPAVVEEEELRLQPAIVQALSPLPPQAPVAVRAAVARTFRSSIPWLLLQFQSAHPSHILPMRNRLPP